MNVIDITMHKAYKYRIDEKKLVPETRQYLMQCFGCARKVYNLYVDYLYSQLESMNFETGAIPNEIKIPEVAYYKNQDEYSYLKDVDSLALANAKANFQKAVKRYNDEEDHIRYTNGANKRAKSGTEPLSFRGLKGMPKFHSKAHGDFSYTTNCQYTKNKAGNVNSTIKLKGNILYLPKIKCGLPIFSEHMSL